MKKHLIISGIVFVLLIVGLSGCNDLNPLSSDKDKFVGTWSNSTNSVSITFYIDGKTSMSGFGQTYTGTWEEGEDVTINNQHLKTVTMNLFGQTASTPYEFKDNNLYLYTPNGLIILMRQ